VPNDCALFHQVDYDSEMLYNVTEILHHPCSHYRRGSGEIQCLKNIPVITKAADEKLAAFIYERILD
jgi:hypothetical protein